MNLPVFITSMRGFLKPALVFSAAIFLASCTSHSEQLEQQAVECWGKGWRPTTDPSGEKFWKGIDSLDQYLLAKGYLGKGMPADYANFSDDSATIVIPETAPGYRSMQLSLYGEFAGAPDVSVIGNCIRDNVIANKGELDSTDALFRFAVIFEAMSNAGAPDGTMLRDFFAGLTKDEMDRPLIKIMFYFTQCGGMRGSQPRLIIHEPG